MTTLNNHPVSQGQETLDRLPDETDVLIVGAGPVGLLIAYQLSKFGCHNYTIIGEPSGLDSRFQGRYSRC